MVVTYNTSAGQVAVVNVIEFAEILYKLNEHKISDIIATNAIDVAVLGVQKKKIKREEDPVIEFMVLEDDMVFGGAAFGNNSPNITHDSSYKRVKIPLKEVAHDDIVAAIAAQMVEKTVPYQMYSIPQDHQEAYEIIAINAIENFVNPTHVIHIKPNLVIAVDIENLKLKVIDDSGTIRMAVYSDKVSDWKALEIP